MKWLVFIPQGGSGANAAVFQIQTGTGFVEGTPIDLAFAIASDQSAGTSYLRLFTGVPGAEILFDNFSAMADPFSASSVPKDLTPWEIGQAEPLWMADDASCLLKAGTGKYILWKPDGTSYSIVTNNFLAHRLTRNGAVVGTLTVTNTVDEWTNKIAHTVGVQWDFQTNLPVPLTTNEYYWPKDTPPSSDAGKVFSLTNPVYGQPQYLTNVTRYPELQEVWDMNSNVVAVGSACVRGPFTWEQVLFGADETMDWFTASERGLDAGAGTNSVTETRYDALLSTAAQFNTNDWRWLGPVSSGNSPAIALLVNDAGMIAGYGAVQTGDPILDALRPTHAFRAPAAGEFNGSDIILTNDLGVLTNGLHSFPRAMNQTGEVVGYSDYNVAKAGLAILNPTNFHAVFWALTNQAPDDLHSLQQLTTNDPPSGFSDAYAINDQSQIVGTSWRNCYTARRTILINVPDGNGGVQTQPVIVQTNVFVLQPGDVVLLTDVVSVAALWQRNHNTNSAPFWEITDLNDRLTDTNWQVFNAVGINSNGLMLAYATKTASNQQNLADAQNATGENHAVLLVTPQLAVDANRDGTITFDDADQTTAAKPYRFWLNDDQDESKSDWKWTEDDPEIYENLPTHPDSDDRIINSPRDCEDLTRLWVDAGNLANYVRDYANDLYLGLKWENVGDTAPSIRLFRSADTSGGLGHIKDATVAAKQADPTNSLSSCLVDADFTSNGIDQVRPTDRLADFIFTKHTFADLD